MSQIINDCPIFGNSNSLPKTWSPKTPLESEGLQSSAIVSAVALETREGGGGWTNIQVEPSSLYFPYSFSHSDPSSLSFTFPFLILPSLSSIHLHVLPFPPLPSLCIFPNFFSSSPLPPFPLRWLGSLGERYSSCLLYTSDAADE